jgi:hypothetical protein
MVTDPRPRSIAQRAEYDRSDKLISVILPDDSRLREFALGIESAMSLEAKTPLQAACNHLLLEAAGHFDVAPPVVRVLGSRPLRVYETGASELFGDYQINTALIRVWMRTAVRKRVTSFGTFLSTLCHEFCHHLDLWRLGLPSSYHTRGFYRRTAVLYHHCRGTPLRPLFWRRVGSDRWGIDWALMNRNRAQTD